LWQAASTDSRVLVETGLSGISSLCVFWRILMASVEPLIVVIGEGQEAGNFSSQVRSAIGSRLFNGLSAGKLADFFS
jgi:hypothetical protein